MKRGLRIGAAWTVLAANVACSFGTSIGDDPPPPPAPASQPAAPGIAEPVPAPGVAAPAPMARAAAPGVGNDGERNDGDDGPGGGNTDPAPAPAGAPVQLSTGFLPDPQTARGRAGGPVNGGAMTQEADGCTGWIPAAPQHTLVLQTAFENLRIVVNASGDNDTTLIIRGPDGTYHCNDDAEGVEGFNPIVSGDFAAGSYQVWVGTYNEEASAQYVIGFTEYTHVMPESLGE